MIDKLKDALNNSELTHRDLEGAQRVFEFLAKAIKETRVELEVQGIGEDAEVIALLKAGQRIPAIKRYRELVPGCGLKVAKDKTDQMCRDLGLPGWTPPWGVKP